MNSEKFIRSPNKYKIRKSFVQKICTKNNELSRTKKLNQNKLFRNQ